MGGGISVESAQKVLAPTAAKRAGTHRRRVKKGSNDYMQLILERFDKSKTGSLMRAEVKELCTTIMNEVTPLLGGVTDEDVDAVMRLGGPSCRPEITYEELPAALGIVMALKSENFQTKDLFDRHDVDKTNKLTKEQVTSLLTEVNDGIIPTDKDLDFVIAQCDLSGDGCVELAQMKAALTCWLCLAEEAALPKTVEEAKEMGYTDDQIERVVAASNELEAAADGSPAKAAAESKTEAEGVTSPPVDAASSEAASAVEEPVAATATEASADSRSATEPAAEAPATETAAPVAESPAAPAEDGAATGE